MSMHSYIVTNSWAQCGCYRVFPPFYNKSHDTPPTAPPSLSNVNMHKKCASLTSTGQIWPPSIPLPFPYPTPQNKFLAHQYTTAAAITLLLYTIIQAVL